MLKWSLLYTCGHKCHVMMVDQPLTNKLKHMFDKTKMSLQFTLTISVVAQVNLEEWKNINFVIGRDGTLVCHPLYSLQTRVRILGLPQKNGTFDFRIRMCRVWKRLREDWADWWTQVKDQRCRNSPIESRIIHKSGIGPGLGQKVTSRSSWLKR